LAPINVLEESTTPPERCVTDYESSDTEYAAESDFGWAPEEEDEIEYLNSAASNVNEEQRFEKNAQFCNKAIS